MRICFFCYTPFHVFNAINVKTNLHSRDEADLYLYNSSLGGTDGIYESLKNIGLFKNIYRLDNIRWNRYSRIKKLLFIHERLFRVNKKKKNALKNYKVILKENHVYDIVWSYGSEMEMYILLGISLRTNPNTRYMCYEEGTGSYFVPCTNYLKKDEIEYLSDGFSLDMPDIPDKMLFYLPECVPSFITAPIDSMPKVTDKLFDDVYSKIWDIQGVSLSYDVFFMAHGSNDQSLAFGIYDYLRVYNNVSTVIKAHPRFITPFENKSVNLLDCGTVPWEIVCGKIDNLESKLLIGIFSTALLTAKSIYGKEPYVIFLNEMHELKENERLVNDGSEFLSHFIQSYSDPSKVFCPRNMKELKEHVNTWYKREIKTKIST